MTLAGGEEGEKLAKAYVLLMRHRIEADRAKALEQMVRKLLLPSFGQVK